MPGESIIEDLQKKFHTWIPTFFQSFLIASEKNISKLAEIIEIFKADSIIWYSIIQRLLFIHSALLLANQREADFEIF